MNYKIPKNNKWFKQLLIQGKSEWTFEKQDWRERKFKKTKTDTHASSSESYPSMCVVRRYAKGMASTFSHSLARLLEVGVGVVVEDNTSFMLEPRSASSCLTVSRPPCTLCARHCMFSIFSCWNNGCLCTHLRCHYKKSENLRQITGEASSSVPP